jgi:hypothetical protein
MNPTTPAPYKLTAAEIATFLSEKRDLVVGRAPTRAPSKYAPLIKEAGIGGGFEVMRMQNEKGRPYEDSVINVQKQNLRNALAALVEAGEMPAAHAEFMNIRPDGSPASEIVFAIIKEGAPAKRAPRKATEPAPAPVATEPAPA